MGRAIILQSVVDAVLLMVIGISVAGIICAVSVVLLGLTGSLSRESLAIKMTQTAIFTGAPFAIIGITAGYMTGLSREAAVAALVPAALTLVGAVGVYLFGQGGRVAIVATFAMVNFAVLLVVGISMGSRLRIESENMLSSYEAKKREVEIEFLLDRYRRGLGLDSSGAGVSTQSSP